MTSSALIKRMKSLTYLVTAAVIGASTALTSALPASAGFFTNCREIRDGNSFNRKTMLCDGDFGNRVIVECNSLGNDCIKICTVGGIGDGCGY